LYTAAFCFLATAVLGQVIANDRGWLGQWIRRVAQVSDAAGVTDVH
jgi:hypothetical protein